MNSYLDIFFTFFKIGLFGFGGGYAVIPLIQNAVEAHGWMNAKQFGDVMSVSAMAPGPIAANSATIIGFESFGVVGAAIACIGIILPSLLLILLIGRLLTRFHEHPVVSSAFYGLRASIVGIITFAAVKFAEGNGMIGGTGIVDIKGFIIAAFVFVILLKTKIHPLWLILVSGLAGILLYG